MGDPPSSELSQSLVRRYSFNEKSGTTLIDSVGGLNGTIVDRTGSGTTSGNGGFARSGTGVRLFGGSDETSDFIELPENLLAGLTDATIELWGTRNSIQNWARMFDFGPSGSEYFMATWNEFSNPNSGRIEWVDQGVTSASVLILE